MAERLDRVDDLRVYRDAFEAAMRLFELSRAWPREERHALIDQVRRSSRAVCANLAEAWAKRPYPRHFVSKLSDARAEAEETRTWIAFAVRCNYLSPEETEELGIAYDRIIGGLVRMLHRPDQWSMPAGRVSETEKSYDAD